MFKSEIDLIETILEEASALLRSRYADRSDINVRSKSEKHDLLTDADIETQKCIVDRIRDAFPSDCIVAEEQGLQAYPTEPDARTWFIDPIDGTQNFVSGIFPVFGISIAFAPGPYARAGGISLPTMNQVFLAEHGQGAYRNGARISVSTTANLEIARLQVDFGSFHGRTEALEAFATPMLRAGQIRTEGSAVASMCSVATGDSDSFCHLGLSSWDFAAAALLVGEAGGKCTRLDGSPPPLNDSVQSVIATNAIIHDELLSSIGAR